jgi:hypothetical protein
METVYLNWLGVEFEVRASGNVIQLSNNGQKRACGPYFDPVVIHRVAYHLALTYDIQESGLVPRYTYASRAGSFESATYEQKERIEKMGAAFLEKFIQTPAYAALKRDGDKYAAETRFQSALRYYREKRAELEEARADLDAARLELQAARKL